MLQRDPNYRPLKVGGRGLLSAVTYWLAPDHMLVVEVVGYVERYRRFRYGDIQALIIRRTRTAEILRGILTGLAVLLAILESWFVASRVGGAWDTPDTVAAALLGGLLVAALLSLIVNLVRGPTCVCHLLTAVRTHELPRLVRWRKAQAALETLRPLVESAQNGTQAVPSAAASESTLAAGALAGPGVSTTPASVSDAGSAGSMAAETPTPRPPPDV